MQNKVQGRAEETTRNATGDKGLKVVDPTPRFIRLFNRLVSPMIGAESHSAQTL